MRTWSIVLCLALAAGCPGKAPVESAAEAPAATTPRSSASEEPPPPTRTETLGKRAVPVHERVNDACELLETGQSGADPKISFRFYWRRHNALRFDEGTLLRTTHLKLLLTEWSSTEDKFEYQILNKEISNDEVS